ncbi:GNAT family N-acetyltransferase [Roseiarcaceae bacterium H3SJ34-1]|uniref:GNAT family N-acetyltransferase n=1 Tax=Terripilifer ovatus TaxID=3032367 RepID=UPI003AB9A7DF|nr:GNAT family N-acetyltransferase [Roseiarcaceae bacterium H3SJ34-1]
MARGKKIVRKKTAGKKTALKKTAQKKIAGKKLAAKRSAKAAKKAAGKKIAAKSASVKKTSAQKKAVGKTTAKKVTAKKETAKKAVARAAKKSAAAKRAASKVKQVKAAVSSTPPSRRQPPRNSSGRRLAARAPVSRAQLAKKTLVEARRAKPANAQQKAVQKAKQLRARKKALAAKDKRLPAKRLLPSRSPSARVRRNDGSEAPSPRRLSIRAAVTRETSRSPAQRAAVGEPPFQLHQLGIRDEHPTDRAAILALLAEAFGEPSQAERLQALRLEERIGGVLVAQHGERLVGCGALFLNAVESGAGDVPVAEIGVLAVTPSLQRKGIGTQLVLAMIESARASGAKALLAQRLEDLLVDLGFSSESVSKLDGNMTVLGLKLAEDDENELAGRLKLPIS